jgi:hypothetical protein
LRAGGDDDRVAGVGLAVGFDGGYFSVGGGEAVHGGVLQDAAAVVLQRPGVGLHGALRIGVAAEMEHIAPEGVFAG